MTAQSETYSTVRCFIQENGLTLADVAVIYHAIITDIGFDNLPILQPLLAPNGQMDKLTNEAFKMIFNEATNSASKLHWLPSNTSTRSA